MQNTSTTGELPNQPAPIELLDRLAVLRFFGGNRPLHTSTLYRGIHNGTYPKPFNVSSGSTGAARWLRSECEAALQRMVAARDIPKPKPIGRGRKRRQRIA